MLNWKGGLVKVFISWSKPRSKQPAQLLRRWLPEVIQEIEPWVSSEDIDKGQRWGLELAGRLSEISQGILCVTAENVDEPWLIYEAGSLAKSLDESRVRPLLLDLLPYQIKGPLAQFQATVMTDREDMYRLLASLNLACNKPLDEDRLIRAFERNWQTFIDEVQILLSSPQSSPFAHHRTADDMMTEVLDIVRQLQRTQSSISPTITDPVVSRERLQVFMERIEQRRIELGMTKTELAAHMQVPRGIIAMMHSGRLGPTAEFARTADVVLGTRGEIFQAYLDYRHQSSHSTAVEPVVTVQRGPERENPEDPAVPIPQGPNRPSVVGNSIPVD